MISALELLERFERADPAARLELLRREGMPTGFAKAYFDRVAQLVGHDPQAAVELAKSWNTCNLAGDDRGYAWRIKAVLERLRGEWGQSAKSFIRSGSLALDPVDQISFKTGAIDSLARCGKVRSAIKLGDEIADALLALNRPELAGRALLNVGNALMWGDQYADAKRYFERATELLKRSEFRLELCAAQLGISTTGLFSGPLRKNLIASQRVEERLRELGFPHHAVQAQFNQAHCLIRMGAAESAVELLVGLKNRLDSKSIELARAYQYLGDAYLSLQLNNEAIGTFESGLELTGLKHSALNRANMLMGLSEGHLRKGDALNAIQPLKEAAAIYRKSKNLPFAWLAHLAQARAEIMAGERDESFSLLRKAVEYFESIKNPFFMARCLLELANQTPSVQVAQAITNRADEICKQQGYSALKWHIHYLRAQSAEGRYKRKHYRKMVEELLRQRAQLRSVYSRASLLADKQQALREYLAYLIVQETEADLAEALDVIRKFRAVVLIDELLQDSERHESAHLRSALDELRAEIEEEGGQLPGGPVRSAESSGSFQNKTFAKLLETLLDVPISRDPLAEGGASPFIFAVLPDDICWLGEEHSSRTRISEKSLKARLDWIYFDLLSPLYGQNVDCPSLRHALEGLADQLHMSELESEEGYVAICPESVGFRVPWSLIVQDREAGICLLPQAAWNPKEICLKADPNVLILYSNREELPHIQSEIELLNRFFPGAKTVGTLAEWRSIQGEEQFDLVHFAAHGRFQPDNPMFSSIELEGGHLMAHEFALSGPRVDLAVLGSCESGALGNAGHWEPQGWVRAMMVRGAKAVVGAQWPIDDHANFVASSTFYRKMRENFSLYDSVRSMRVAVREAMDHPVHWGAMVMFLGAKK